MIHLSNYIQEKLHIKKGYKGDNTSPGIFEQIMNHTFISKYLRDNKWPKTPFEEISEIIIDWLKVNNVNNVAFYTNEQDMNAMKLNNYDEDLLKDIKVIDKSDIAYKIRYKCKWSDGDISVGISEKECFLKVIYNAIDVIVEGY